MFFFNDPPTITPNFGCTGKKNWVFIVLYFAVVGCCWVCLASISGMRDAGCGIFPEYNRGVLTVVRPGKYRAAVLFARAGTVAFFCCWL